MKEPSQEKSHRSQHSRKKRFLASVVVGVMWLAGQAASANTISTAPPVPDTTAPPSQHLNLMEQIDAFVVPSDIRADEAWLHIDLMGRRLVLLRGEERVETIPYVAYGASGYRRVRVQGSNQTPVGEFTIQRVNAKSKFRTFLEFDYPSPSTAWAARAAGLLSDEEYRYFQSYRQQHGMSPPDTGLGGHIGLHGLGRSDEWTHMRRDWTEGCIAVTNEEIDRIDRWIDVGSKVVIRG